MNEDYLKFLETKQKAHIFSGFDIEENKLNKYMFPFQKFITKRALKAGKYAIFADCGLGKTLMQLEKTVLFGIDPVLGLEKDRRSIVFVRDLASTRGLFRCLHDSSMLW